MLQGAFRCHRSVGILIRRLHLHLCTSLLTPLTGNYEIYLLTLFCANYHNEFDYFTIINRTTTFNCIAVLQIRLINVFISCMVVFI